MVCTVYIYCALVILPGCKAQVIHHASSFLPVQYTHDEAFRIVLDDVTYDNYGYIIYQCHSKFYKGVT